MANWGKKTLANVAIPLVWDNLLELVSNLTSNAINKFDRKISGYKDLSKQEKNLLYFFQMKASMILLKL